ncbi:MAG: carbohydrate ABC transporter permease [Spirochaetota bacterium]
MRCTPGHRASSRSSRHLSIRFPQLAVVPSLFTWFRDLGLTNSYLGIVIAYVGLFTPLALWILTTYFRTIPLELEESARMDGCSVFRMIGQIIIPVAMPGVVAAALIVIIQTWNEFFLALVILARNHLRTATVGIALYPGEYAFPWDLITTATFLAIIPIFGLTVLFQRRIIGGLTSGSVK